MTEIPRSSDRRSVLISGASIAGPALAFWLNRYGFEVTVVERASAVRSGGYPIDIRGSAIEVVERMGLLPRLRAAHIDTQKLTFVDGEGKVIAAICPEAMTGGVASRDIELPRGSLTSVLYEQTQGPAIRYRFGDSIEALEDTGRNVNVRFRSGEKGAFDIVIGADGIHSNTRALVFGAEELFDRYLGRCFNLFSVPKPKSAALSHEGIIYAEPGRAAGVYAVGDSDTLHAFLIFASEKPASPSTHNADTQRRITAETFAGDGWKVPRLVEAMQHAEDLYYDTVSQIHMPRWSQGRVALVGDAAYAPSFLSGQGTSLALVGAYVLAGELATHTRPEDAFAAYEARVRPFVEVNQALASSGGSTLLPRTREELERRNEALIAAQSSQGEGAHAARRKQVHSAIELPDYGEMLG